MILGVLTREYMTAPSFRLLNMLVLEDPVELEALSRRQPRLGDP